jgi:16S rRNA (uracil1498-N3)-methyltransferase
VNPALRHSAAHVFVASVDDPALHSDDAHHLLRVLRLRDGESVSVSDGRGAWRLTTLSSGALIPAGEVDRSAIAAGRARRVVISAIPKGDRVEWMVQKLTELGVDEIVLLHAERSVVRWDAARAGKQLPRLERIVREAAMQSRRVWMPVVRGPIDFAEAATVPGAALAEPDAPRLSQQSCVVIGPEGGFSVAELGMGVPSVSVADTVLRVETAAVAVASIWAFAHDV